MERGLTGVLEEDGLEEGLIGVWEVGGRVATENSIIEVNVLTADLGEALCGRCGERITEHGGVVCSRCGRPEHRACSRPRARHTLWYCEGCVELLPASGETDDPAEDLELQGFLLGAPPPQWMD